MKLTMMVAALTLLAVLGGFPLVHAEVPEECRRQCALDLEEGADVLMVKPALPYLDVIRAVRERFDSIPSPVAAIENGARRIVVMERIEATSKWIEGHVQPALALCVPGYAVRFGQLGTRGLYADRVTRPNDEHLVAAGEENTFLRHLNARIGHVQLAIGTDGNVIEKYRAERREVDCRERRAAVTIEAAQRVDVAHPERIAVNHHALRRMEGYAMQPSLRERRDVADVRGTNAADIAIVVLHRSKTVDVAHEVYVLIGVVPHRLGLMKVDDCPDARRACGERTRRGLGFVATGRGDSARQDT